MQIGVQTVGLDKVRSVMDKLSGPQLRQAMASALNDTGFHVRRRFQEEIGRVFDRPTPYVLNSPAFGAATPESLTIEIMPTYYGGKGIDPQQILRAQEAGGRRHDKRSEVALRRAGILPQGYQLTIPAKPYPGSDDGRGNLRGPFVAQLISYLQASGEQGYRANMTDRNKRRLAFDRSGPVQPGRQSIGGRRYFVAYGRLRGSGRSANLAPGIWAAAGPGGVDVQPVVMFVRAGSYKPRLSTERVAQAAQVGEYLGRRMRFRIRQAAGI